MSPSHRLTLAPLVLLAGCGPTPREAAAAVLVALPVALLVGHLLVRLLVWLWRPVRRLPLSARPALVAAGVAAAVAVATAVIAGEDALDWVGAALVLFGTSYLTLLLVVWRLWLLLDAVTASSWSFVPVVSISVLPGIPLLLGVSGDYADLVLVAWVLPGYGGTVAGPLLVLLVVEALVRRFARRS
jgi:hypothetical protein